MTGLMKQKGHKKTETGHTGFCFCLQVAAHAFDHVAFFLHYFAG